MYVSDLHLKMIFFRDMETLNHYIGPIFILILKKLQNVKQDKFLIVFVRFIFCFFAIEKEGAGPDYIIQVIDSIQPRYSNYIISILHDHVYMS